MSPEENSECSPNPPFTKSYTCVPLLIKGQHDIERGGKLLLPHSALKEINFLDIPYPLMFKVTNGANNRFTHAGVLEFTAEEGQVNTPQWMLNHLGLKPGDQITVETVSLPSGTFCRVEALTRNFAYVSDTKTLLEKKFKNFGCLTEGDILFMYERSCNQLYKLKIAHTEPESAVNIFECDLEFDYSVPKEISNRKSYKEEYEIRKSSELEDFQGTGYRLDGNPVDSSSNIEKILVKKPFVAFNGTGHVLQSKKRKVDEKNCNEPPEKKKKENDNSYKPNELIFIREQQQNYLRKSSSSQITPFQGHGHSLKDD